MSNKVYRTPDGLLVMCVREDVGWFLFWDNPSSQWKVEQFDQKWITRQTTMTDVDFFRCARCELGKVNNFDFQEFCERGYDATMERLGQAFCNFFGFQDARLFYMTSEKDAHNRICSKYLEKS